MYVVVVVVAAVTAQVDNESRFLMFRIVFFFYIFLFQLLTKLCAFGRHWMERLRQCWKVIKPVNITFQIYLLLFKYFF
jgi:hypothetical protein